MERWARREFQGVPLGEGPAGTCWGGEGKMQEMHGTSLTHGSNSKSYDTWYLLGCSCSNWEGGGEVKAVFCILGVSPDSCFQQPEYVMTSKLPIKNRGLCPSTPLLHIRLAHVHLPPFWPTASPSGRLGCVHCYYDLSR